MTHLPKAHTTSSLPSTHTDQIHPLPTPHHIPPPIKKCTPISHPQIPPRPTTPPPIPPNQLPIPPNLPPVPTAPIPNHHANLAATPRPPNTTTPQPPRHPP
ncbi:hypothetical protein PGT21_021873 [Puccinia graminis f. sp. tritici]|uniref:Uncharacterized protein n=1 Tax=Puccinia graminis f. sp. tritici TaxID=56615 RepID=A0A5B0MNN3_PUCGR|nr:hypothetical protein PGT21_021873 [Puccinia graminis f. sp. tritici]